MTAFYNETRQSSFQALIFPLLLSKSAFAQSVVVQR